MSQVRGFCSGFLFLALGFVAVGPATADWLVTREGAKIETKGAWQVKGKQVVFTQKNGQLSALRLSDVDLDASAKATTQTGDVAATANPEPKVATKKPVLVLTDKDVGHVSDEPPAKAVGEGSPDPAAVPPSTGSVLVDTWEKAPTADGNGIEIFGGIRNTGKDTATDISISVKIYDEAGGLLGTSDATVSSSILPPNGSSNFRATFPGILRFVTARFEVKNRALLNKPADASGAKSGG